MDTRLAINNNRKDIEYLKKFSSIKSLHSKEENIKNCQSFFEEIKNFFEVCLSISDKEKDEKTLNTIFSKLNCFLLVTNLVDDSCLYASENITKFLGIKQQDIIGMKLNKVLPNFNDEQMKQLTNTHKSESSKTSKLIFFHFNQTDDEALKKSNFMDCVGMLYSSTSSNQNDLSLSLISPSKDSNLSISNKTSEEQKGPPNQTINTRDKIPEPETFMTHQTISGKMTLMRDNQMSTCKRDMIERYLKAFTKFSTNGSSLAQTLHKKVVSQGEAKSCQFKFQLSDGTSVTAFTKSKFVANVQKQEPPFVVSVHHIYKDGTLNHFDLNSLPNRTKLNNLEFGLDKLDDFELQKSCSPSPLNFLSEIPPIKTETVHPAPTLKRNDFHIKNHRNWSNSFLRQQNSAKVVKELLISTGADVDTEEIVNSVLSPPPHLDGYLVHSIGSNIQLNNCDPIISSTSNFSSYCSKLGSEESYLMEDTHLNNPATYPGPPCVDLSEIDVSQEDRIKRTFSDSFNKPNLLNSDLLLSPVSLDRQRHPSSSSFLSSSSLQGPLTSLPSHTICSSDTTPPSGDISSLNSSADHQDLKHENVSKQITSPEKRSSEDLIKEEHMFSKIAKLKTEEDCDKSQDQILASKPKSPPLDSFSNTDQQGVNFQSNFGAGDLSKEELDELNEILGDFIDAEDTDQQDPSLPLDSSQDFIPTLHQMNGPTNFESSRQPHHDLDVKKLQNQTASKPANHNIIFNSLKQNPNNKILSSNVNGCPNMVVNSNGAVSTQHSHSLQNGTLLHPESQINRISGLLGLDLEQCEGQEPLIDLGAVPPPAGINPRMTIPYSNNNSTCLPANNLQNPQMNPQHINNYINQPKMVSNFRETKPKVPRINQNFAYTVPPTSGNSCTNNNHPRYQLQIRLNQPQPWRNEMDQNLIPNISQHPINQSSLMGGSPTRFSQPYPSNNPLSPQTYGHRLRLSDGKHIIQKHQQRFISTHRINNQNNSVQFTGGPQLSYNQLPIVQKLPNNCIPTMPVAVNQDNFPYATSPNKRVKERIRNTRKKKKTINSLPNTPNSGVGWKTFAQNQPVCYQSQIFPSIPRMNGHKPVSVLNNQPSCINANYIQNNSWCNNDLGNQMIQKPVISQSSIIQTPGMVSSTLIPGNTLQSNPNTVVNSQIYPQPQTKLCEQLRTHQVNSDINTYQVNNWVDTYDNKVKYK